MKSIVVRKYGGPDVLELVERPIPEVAPGEILIRVIASSVTAADTMMRSGTPRWARMFIGLTQPKQDQIGTCLSGRVEKVGADCKTWKVGDEVFALTSVHFGANSEWVKVGAWSTVWEKPGYLSFEQAAGICDGVTTSMNFLSRVVKPQKGETVIINGASGALGLAALGIARGRGLKTVAICSGRNVDLVRAAGADHVVNYELESPDSLGIQADYFYDTIGKSSVEVARSVLKPGGVYLTPVLNSEVFKYLAQPWKWGRPLVRFSATGILGVDVFQELVEQSLKLIESGALNIYVDRVFRFEDFIQAHEYVETGRKRGNIVLDHRGL